MKVVQFYTVRGFREDPVEGRVNVVVEHIKADGPEEASELAAKWFEITVESVEVWWTV